MVVLAVVQAAAPAPKATSMATRLYGDCVPLCLPPML